MSFRIVPTLALAIALGTAAPVAAQDVTETHVEAALAALQASPASSSYDDLLPAVAENIKGQLILIRPDLHQEISVVVDGIAEGMADRRVELDREVAVKWAEAFTEDELVTIAEFYKSPAGQKFNEIGPKVIAESLVVAENWAQGLRREMFDAAREAMKAQGEEF